MANGWQEPKRQVVVVLAHSIWAASVDAVEVAAKQGDGVHGDANVLLNARVVKLLVQQI